MPSKPNENVGKRLQRVIVTQPPPELKISFDDGATNPSKLEVFCTMRVIAELHHPQYGAIEVGCRWVGNRVYVKSVGLVGVDCLEYDGLVRVDRIEYGGLVGGIA